MRYVMLLSLGLLGGIFVKGQSVDTTYYDNGVIRSVGGFNQQNQPSGKWITYFRNGQVEREGTYRAGHPVGVWKEYYENGQLKAQLAFLVRGNEAIKNGKYVMYHENGKIAVKGQYAYGRKIQNTWKEYDEDGNLIPKEEE